MKKRSTNPRSSLISDILKRDWAIVCKATFALLMFFLMQTTFAQTTLTWTGASSTNAFDPTNWTPQQAIRNNALVIDSAHKWTNPANAPVFGGADSSAMIYSLTLHPTGSMTINFASTDTLFNVSTEYFEPHGEITINKGTLQARRLHIEDTNTVINVNSGGILKARKYFFMSGDGNNRPVAGFLNISGTGKAIYTAEQASGGFGRFPVDTTTGVITFYPNGTLDLKGNFLDFCNTLKAKRQLLAAPGWAVTVDYDAGTDWTYVYVQDASKLYIEPADPIRIYEDEEGPEVSVVKNAAYDERTSIEWKYGTASGGPYTSFAPAETADSIFPEFADPGFYYLVCVGYGVTDTLTSNEVEVVVGSSLVTVAPKDDQYLKPGLDGATLRVTKDASITGVEWKWSSTLGSGYQSFSPAQTDTFYVPNFDTSGAYYVICEGTDGGTDYTSSDVMIIVNESTMNIYWKGSVSEDADVVENWEPLANFKNNTVYVQGPTTYIDSLSFNGFSTQTVNSLNVADSSTITIDKGNDTLYVNANSNYGIVGDLNIVSGILNYRDLRLEVGTINITGGKLYIRAQYFMLSNSGLTTGGYINISGNGVLETVHIDRISTDSTKSVITLRDNALFLAPGDWRPTASNMMNETQLKALNSQTLLMWYDVAKNQTPITTRFGIFPIADYNALANVPATTISAVNNTGVTAYQWKYSREADSGFGAFSPAQTAATCAPVFPDSGTYYLICEGTKGADVLISNPIKFDVIAVTIAPAALQKINIGETGTTLTVSESVTADSREWKSSTTSGSGYEPFIPPQTLSDYTPLFLNPDTFYVVCESTIGELVVTSNEVTIIAVDPDAIQDNLAGAFRLYPNPANSAFTIEAGRYRDYSLKIIDLQGKEVFSREFITVNGPQTIKLEQKGVFIVKITAGDESEMVRLIIE